MRIEIYKDANGISIADGFSGDLNTLLKQSESMISSLEHIKRCSYIVNGGIGSLKSAVDSLDLKISNEKNRQTALNDIRSRYYDFIEHVDRADSSAEEKVSQNTEEFYNLNQWALPSIHFDDFLKWGDKAKSWLKKDIYNIFYALNHITSIMNENDYTLMDFADKDKFKENYDKFIKMLDSGELDPDDRVRLELFMNYLGETKVSCNEKSRRSTKIAYYNDLYEKLYPDKKINSSDNNYKYLIYRAGCSEGFASLASDVLKHGELSTGNISDMEKEEVYRHGNFNLYDFNSSKNDDGSVTVEFSMSTQWKTMTEITVYDADGKICGERKYLAGQRDPTGIVGCFKEEIKYVDDMLHSRFFSHNAEAMQSTDNFRFDIPQGGFIRITDDISLMSNDPYSSIAAEEILNKTEIAVDISDVINTGDAFIDTTLELAASSGFQFFHDIADDPDIDFQNICKNILDNACETLGDDIFSEIADIWTKSGNPAGVGLKGVECILKANTFLESKVAGISESRTKGNGAIIICS